MLDPNEKNVFDEMVNHLRTADPKFATRMERIGHPRRRPRVLLAILLWTIAPVAIFLGGWTGFLMAVVGSCYAVHLVSRQRGFGDAADGFSWWSSSRRSSLGG